MNDDNSMNDEIDDDEVKTALALPRKFGAKKFYFDVTLWSSLRW